MLKQIKETADFLKTRIATNPKVGIILGTGLGNLAEQITDSITIPYQEIPNFPISTVEGHSGCLIIGKLGGKDILAMKGRFHYYEGYSMQQVTFPIRVFKALGVELLIVTNASGAVNPAYQVGDIMLINDHINLMPNPLIGPNDERLGTRFPSMSTIYDKKLLQQAHEIAKARNIKLQEGVYVGTSGPSFETPAEYKFFRTIGADTVGMSTVPEVIVASHSQMRVFGMSVISNVFKETDIADCTHEEVLQGVAKAGNLMSELVKDLIA